MRKIRIHSTGHYLPKRVVTSLELDDKLGLEPGTVESRSGVKQRHWVEGENALDMAEKAVQEAIDRASIGLEDIDAIVCAMSVPHQHIPCSAALLQRRLGLQDSTIPCFDINATCLSFLTALDMLSYAIDAGRFKRVLIVSSEVASVGITWKETEVTSLFGDAAACAIVEFSDDSQSSALLASDMQTYSDGADLCTIRGGGTGLYPTQYNAENHEQYMFTMQGPDVYKLSLRIVPKFVKNIMNQVEFEEFPLFIVHQASGAALALMKRALHVPEDKFINIIENIGNTVASSLPLTLHHAITSGRLQRGDKFVMGGTSAGISVGVAVFEY
ncbi:MAG: beta-ketoacyl-ACP synthase III [Gammaproteobacteria bacterium]|nr:beta-ketoacyl-ACP synthase III [Gammaproteobacteria bacterium]